jgi:Txe/YoeB family toxin of Txe-Axe toxin-antitoxin module
MSTKSFSFVVDLSQTMIVSNISSSKNDNQKLYCKCGHSQQYSQKIKRNIVKNYDELTEDGNSIQSVVCGGCGEVYDFKNKVFLINPNIEELYNIRYTLEKNGSKYNLNRHKFLVFHSEANNDISKKEIVDTLVVDLKNNKIKLSVNEFFLNKEIISSVLGSDFNVSEQKLLSENLDITNISLLEEFFHFKDSVNYEGLSEIYKLVKTCKDNVKDLDKFNDVFFLNFINSNEINFDVEADGTEIYYQNIDSGFGDGTYIKKRIVNGDFLFNLLNAYKLLFSLITFENSSTIILTKGYNFFTKWIESKYLKSPEIYKNNDSTNPISIIETSLDDNQEIKISQTIYNSIKSVNDLENIINNDNFKILKKNELENLLQNYNSKRVYSLISKISNLHNRNEERMVNFKHVEHILKNNIDEDVKSDFLTIYVDTIRVIGLLELKDKTIFKCRDYQTLKGMHDDYTSRYNVMKDLKKAEIYKKSVSKFENLNTIIGDVEFTVVPTAERLNLEGLQMNHCIYTYLNRICDENYLAINVNHLITKERATAGFIRKGNKLELEQLKGFYNSRATRELIETTIEFCNKNKLTINTFNRDLTPEESRQRPMPGQMSENDLFNIMKEKGVEVEVKTKKKEFKETFLKKIFK